MMLARAHCVVLPRLRTCLACISVPYLTGQTSAPSLLLFGTVWTVWSIRDGFLSKGAFAFVSLQITMTGEQSSHVFNTKSP
jgi:hypothetical protein